MTSPAHQNGGQSYRRAYQLINGRKMPPFFSSEAIKSALNHKVQNDDIVLCTYPKCGTNWTQQLVTLLRNQAQPITGGLNLIYACPFLEMIGADALEKSRQKSPRFYKVHFDYHTVDSNPNAKYIAVVRNPKDCLISMYHFLNMGAHGYQNGMLESFFRDYVTGEIAYGCYFDFVLSWYEHRRDPNVLFLYYENMKEDIEGNVRKIARFLGPQYEELVRDERKMKDVVYYSSVGFMKEHFSGKVEDVYQELGLCSTGVDLEEMDLPVGLKHSLLKLRDRPVTDGSGGGGGGGDGDGKAELVRKGVVGDGKVALTPEMNAVMDGLIEKRLAGTEMYDYWKKIDCI